MIDQYFNGYRRIFIKDNELAKELSGKTVENILLTYVAYYTERNMFIITFTDKTFICIGIHHGEKDDSEYDYLIDNIHFPDEDYVKRSKYFWVDHNDNTTHFYKDTQSIIDMGLCNLKASDCQEYIINREKEKEEREYQEYLRLKEKYEK